MSIKEFCPPGSTPEKNYSTAVIKGESFAPSHYPSDMAVAFENVTRIPAHFWLKQQRNYDEYQARARKRSHNSGGLAKWANVSRSSNGKS